MIELDQLISGHLGLLLRRGFTETGASENAGYGYTERIYAFDHVALKASYERGLSGFELGCADHADEWIGGSSIRDLLDPPNLGHWNLGMGAAAFVHEHWDQVYEMLKPSNWPTTLRRVDEFARRHA